MTFSQNNTLGKMIKLFTPKPYELGLVLSGGGAKGMAHAGVLKALEEIDIKPDIIAGTSAGAIVGAMYAAGSTPTEILGTFRDLEFRKMTQIQTPKTGFFNISRFEKYLSKQLKVKTFEELSIPLKVIATNFDTGAITVFDKGNLLDAIIASSTVPVLFTPKRIGETNYVDGGVVKNLPVSIIREECDKIIAVNLNPIVTDMKKNSIINTAMRAYHFLFTNNTIYDKTLCDILIEPEKIATYEMFEIEKSNEIFQTGYQTARKIFGTNDK